jgi:hypothetical protein
LQWEFVFQCDLRNLLSSIILKVDHETLHAIVKPYLPMSLLMSCLCHVLELAYSSWTHILPFSNPCLPPWFNCLLTHPHGQTMGWFCDETMVLWFLVVARQLVACSPILIKWQLLLTRPLQRPTLSFPQSLPFSLTSSLPFSASLYLSLSLTHTEEKI